MLWKFAYADEVQGVDGPQNLSVQTSSMVRAPERRSNSLAEVEFTKHSSGFTLLEVLIALALVAILMVAAAPYMSDALKMNKGDHVTEAIATLVEQTRAAALNTGDVKYIDFTDSQLLKLLPDGWKLQIERMSDKKFRSPTSGEHWEFNSEGISEPLTLRIQGPESPIVMKFDPITGQVIHEEL
ncbi:MAG: hypothetical protein A3F67_06055 [Verrucomicrobia bacterium RIFCSPHIGHO2_12_FULL_41_10]|nr:MAG: hypothetical protein A3F67_06055 [Verrucomicrobia bacterium RIFCSPHIGHO2_12_FULL_41_10]